MITVKVWAPVHPTEDRAKVQSAIDNIFAGLEFQFRETQGMTARLVGSGDQDSLVVLHGMLRSRKILDTARRHILIDGDTLSFSLNKQAAAAGKASFSPDDEPLGSIFVEIFTQSIEEAKKVIDWLAPPTREGLPMFEIELSPSYLYNDKPT